MKIGSIGYNYVHDMKYENFIMDRPKGPGAILLLLIKTPAVFKVGGVQYQVRYSVRIKAILKAERSHFNGRYSAVRKDLNFLNAGTS